ncbi:unnamed protein product [Heligmosomoides polygyrus]|uniref:Retrotransposon protein n=1 Tax=Heligmosomoides polygyrus TaxID=6339 RepID=A0A3P8BZB4_HELPZ|nr:unnamed protein product [Heligmosomoides polygyrus]
MTGEYIRVVSMPNPEHLNLPELVAKFLEEVVNLYLRRRIMKMFHDKEMTPSEMLVKNGYITISGLSANGTKRFRSTELSVLLGLDYSDWNGTAISKMLTLTERRNLERFRSTELSVLLGLDYSDWNGTAISKMLTLTERRNLEEGKLTWGSLDLFEEYSSHPCHAREHPVSESQDDGSTSEQDARTR